MESRGDQGTLYQLKNIIQRRNVVSDPKDNFNACSDFLNIILDAHITMAAATLLGCNTAEDITLHHLIPSGQVPNSKLEQLRHIEVLARRVVERFAVYSVDACHLEDGATAPDGVLNYACSLMNMGLLARNLQDASHEGDGDRIIRCWRFLFLHYKAEGHTKYALEAFRLIADLEVMLSARRAHELKWNRTCSVRGGPGSNIPLDLQMEHLNKSFKTNISRFSSHISEATVKRVSTVTKEIDTICSIFDNTLGIKPQTSVSTGPNDNEDFLRIVRELEAAKVFTFMEKRCHRCFPTIARHPFLTLVNNMDKFHAWVANKKRELAREVAFREFIRHRKTLEDIQDEHSYACMHA